MSPFAIYLYGPQLSPLPSRFDEAAERLRGLDRLHFEMDGSFVWRGTAGEDRWQLDGMIYDSGDRIQYVDLKGECPGEAWHRLREIFAGGPRAAISVLRLPEQRRISGEEFEEEIWGKPSQSAPLA